MGKSRAIYQEESRNGRDFLAAIHEPILLSLNNIFHLYWKIKKTKHTASLSTLVQDQILYRVNILSDANALQT